MESFDKSTPVLMPQRGEKGVRWVLWPVLAWRIVAPVPIEGELNLFQRSVLALARAGIVRATDTAARLCIEPDLAACVALELQGLELVGRDWFPTPRGLQALDASDADPPDEVKVGHVLADPFTGKLWPRFLGGDLQLVDVEPDEEGWPQMITGTRGNPSKRRPFCLLPHPSQIISTRPSPREILQAVSRHRRHRERDGVADGHPVPQLARVSFVEERPQPYFLPLRVRTHESGDWMVDDPFGHGESLDLRTQMERQFDSYPKMRDWIKPQVGADHATATASQLHQEAVFLVESRLTLAIRQQEHLRERLVAMQRALLEANVPDAPKDKGNDVLVKAQRAAERVLRAACDAYRGLNPPLSRDLAIRDVDFNRHLLDELASRLGLQTPLPSRLSRVTRDRVTSPQGLRPLILLTLLAAGRDPSHPLHRTGQRAPCLLHRLDALASARNPVAHDGPDSRLDSLDVHVESVFLAAEILVLAT